MAGARNFCFVVGAGLGALATLSPATATGQGRAQVVVNGPGPRAQQGDGPSLKGRVGVAVAEGLMLDGGVEDRIRGVQRLGAIGTPEAVDSLLQSVEQSSALLDPKVRLEAVRALAAHAKRDPVRQVLVREMTDADARTGGSPLAAFARDTAALALARSGEKKAIVALVSVIIQGGATGEAASRALRAYPPAQLQPLLGEGRKPMSPSVAVFLGELGDLRATARLRGMLEQPDLAGKIAAAVALAKLGDERPLTIAREWMKRPDARLQRAAVEVLAYLGAPDARRGIIKLLDADSTRSEGVRLALQMPGPELARPLAAALPNMAAEDRGRAIAAIGRAGGPEAVKALLAQLGKPDVATGAAYALAMMPGPAGLAALNQAIASTKTRGGPSHRLTVRAGVVRALSLRDPPGDLPALLEALLASKDAADRAVGSFGLAATGARSIEELLASKDEAVARAAARGALARGERALAALMPVLVQAAAAAEPAERGGDLTVEPSIGAVAAGVALIASPSGGALSTSRLAAWAEGGGPLAPLAARALPTRDDEVLRPRIKRLLQGSDPVVRAHIALGLARDPEHDAATVLAQAYRFEDDASVRRAIVRALSRREEVQRVAVLTLARDLDPDLSVRALARSALEGRVLDHVTPATAAGDPAAPGIGVAWVSIVANDAAAAPSASSRAARVVRSDGLAVPVVADPDGVLVVPGLPPGAGSLLLAPPTPVRDAPRR